ncbi:MAG: cytidine deaminase [Eubacterium sp.]|nr:cytidine deaminase [Eubacterium sp.]
MNSDIVKLLISEASKARTMAYAQYSNYMVGAALVVPSGRIYTGCNVENASYGLTMCAERTAIFKAVSEGQRHIDAIAIVGGPLKETRTGFKDESDYAYPCGACRQVLAEFLPDKGDIDVIVDKNLEDYKILKLSELLPYTFKLDE